ncbi:MAG: ATP-dependent DNA helicase RecG [Ruminococcaceae bacterium]|nr:ATP-dependent DNA helicase RecG [Oscillospiraceae bacterium]
MEFLDMPVDKLKGVGSARSKQLAKLNIHTVRDMVYFFPRAYENRSDVRPLSNASFDVPCSMILTVGTMVKSVRIKNNMTISKFRAFDESGAVEVVFFNSPYVKDVFTLGAEFRFYGKLSYSKKQIQLITPKYEPYFESKPLPDFIPIYPLTEGLSSKVIDKLMASVIDEALSKITDPLPEKIRLAQELPSLTYAIKNAHFPENEKALYSSLRRLAFDEMLMFGLGIAVNSKGKRLGTGIPFAPCSLIPLLDLLPYELTSDQKKAVNDIYRDTVSRDGKSVSQMTRILVGDVGSGKTICAICAMYIAVKSGYQAALMVPTEILARQHYSDVKELFGKLGIGVELLLGNTSQKEKKRIYSGLSDGSISVVIGTHALISDKVEFNALGLVITDEQHRFGVLQRSKLKGKAMVSHMLVMSATPIPRTLALTMYGDLDISRITEMPKGRMRVDTFVVDETYRERLNDFIRKQTLIGGQCYVVCPAIEAKEDEDEISYVPESLSVPSASPYPELKSAVEYTENLRKALPDLKIECLHGKMKADEKDAIMARFSAGEVNVLVSTTVIEVGINVPNATLMIVENAERFGLSQLHQLRGRVGRGKKKSYCVLVSDMKTEKALSRLNIMKTTYDGYEIADKDLMLRGPGDFFSNNSNDNFRQSGGFEFKFAKLCDDTDLFSSAFATAKEIFARDPELALPEHSALRDALGSIIESNNQNIS